MILQEVYSTYRNYQMILSLSNNEDVLITEDCFNPDSKFFRSSKVRLGVDFVLSGYIHNDSIISTNNQTSINESDVIIFRTYRGQNDYILYIYKGDYKVLQSIRKKISRRKVIKQTPVEQHQITIQEMTKPLPNKVLDICPGISKNTYWVDYKHQAFDTGKIRSGVYSHNMPHVYLGYYAAVLLGLTIAKKYPEQIHEVRISIPHDYYSYGVGKFVTGDWTPNSAYIEDYVRRFNILKKELQELNMTIRFIYREKED
jgi:hypothetical protein